MDKIELANALYERAFPTIVILCAVVGTACFALGAFLQSVVAFAAIGGAIWGNSVVEQRRHERSERLAGLGWTRTRSPLSSF